MATVGQIEYLTQKRLVKLFTDELNYEYYGNWGDRLNNSNIEEKYLREYLQKQNKYTERIIERAIYKLKNISVNFNFDLYNNNKNVYQMLRYRADVSEEAGRRRIMYGSCGW
jgi:type I restriction enzyme R subunit